MVGKRQESFPHLTATNFILNPNVKYTLHVDQIDQLEKMG